MAKNQPEIKPQLLLITGGDPAGIGSEIIRKALVELESSLFTKASDRVVIFYLYTGRADAADSEWQLFVDCCAGLKSKPTVDVVAGQEALLPAITAACEQPRPLQILVHPLAAGTETGITIGTPSALSGRLAFRALELACDLILELQSGPGSSDTAIRISNISLVTAPLSKEWVIRGGVSDFSGHTGYLAKRFGSNVLMLMHGQNFSVIPLTEHVSIANVPTALKKRLAQTDLVDLIGNVARRSVFAGRQVAICALNPHCGEGGLIGNEESEVLQPFIEKLRASGLSITDPLSADTLFMESIRSQYRLIVSCYHDQGLIPFKAFEAENGINVTIGLPFLRTSPDHGTAFGIAGQNLANAASMRRAIEAVLSPELSS